MIGVSAKPGEDRLPYSRLVAVPVSPVGPDDGGEIETGLPGGAEDLVAGRDVGPCAGKFRRGAVGSPETIADDDRSFAVDQVEEGVERRCKPPVDVGCPDRCGAVERFVGDVLPGIHAPDAEPAARSRRPERLLRPAAGVLPRLDPETGYTVLAPPEREDRPVSAPDLHDAGPLPEPRRPPGGEHLLGRGRVHDREPSLGYADEFMLLHDRCPPGLSYRICRPPLKPWALPDPAGTPATIPCRKLRHPSPVGVPGAGAAPGM
ncbi:MAG: hypothetical protein BWX50_01062 [Euryarchaeota archaeon ADurb.Bin009]|nr:MAG: hypothetical protein BWX50_01062 [Euryarchaeota archaeon ADurb.Bin009]